MNSSVECHILLSENHTTTTPRYEDANGAVQPSTTRWIEP